MPAQSDTEIRVHKVKCGRFDNNAYVIVDPRTNESVIIDTPEEPEKVLQQAEGTQVKTILITHNHMDHLLGLDTMRSQTGAPVWIHQADAHALSKPPERLLEGGEVLQVGSAEIRAIHTPGHTPGAMCYVVGRYLFSGDTLFPGGPGHSNTPESLQETISSITAKLFPLPEETVVYPGHGDDTTLKAAKSEYEVFAGKEHPADLHGDVLWLSS